MTAEPRNTDTAESDRGRRARRTVLASLTLMSFLLLLDDTPSRSRCQRSAANSGWDCPGSSG